MVLVDVKVYHLEMLAPPEGSVTPPRAGLAVKHLVAPSVPEYRALYNSVGRDYHWHTRAGMPDAQLAALLDNPLNEIQVLHVDGIAAGFAELDRRQAEDIELVQFGLTPPFIGQGLGRYFLRWTIDKVWSYGPKRFWLHTCTLDHPTALPNYMKAGFTIFREERIQREIVAP